MEHLGLPADRYGWLSLLIALPLLLGAWVSKRLQERVGGPGLIVLGGGMMTVSGFVWLGLVAAGVVAPGRDGALALSVGCAAVVFAGAMVAMPNCLSVALRDYGHIAGTAASLYGLYYYVITAAVSHIMALMHDGTGVRLPLFIAGTGGLMLLTQCFRIKAMRKPEMVLTGSAG